MRSLMKTLHLLIKDIGSLSIKCIQENTPTPQNVFKIICELIQPRICKNKYIDTY